MKSRVSLLLLLSVALCTVFLGACHRLSVQKAYNVVLTPKIFLMISGNPKVLRVSTPGNPNCNARSPLPGCVRVPKGDSVVITYNLQNSPAWHMTEMKICKGDTKTTQVCSLDEWEQSEFAASDKSGSPKYYPGANGVIDLTQISATLTEFDLLDHNSVQANYFYTIMACNSGTGQCLPTDPPIENEGRR